MILVVDSGSTKADWLVASTDTSSQKYSTVGFNPYFHDEKFILNALNSHKDLSEIAYKVTNLYFYGAGCSSEDRIQIIKGALKKIFINAKIEVDHDVFASVRATCGDESGIACILGTGSNSCYFDGINIHKNNYGLGFIMGDEGSGSYFGKKLITHYLYGILPENLKIDFEKRYEMDKEIMITNVYNNSSANVWLASFAKFMTDHKDDPWVIKTVTKGVEEFYNLYVCGYPNYKELKTHFVGSIAFYFEDIIRMVGAKKEVTVGKIVRHPINALAEYFLSKNIN